MSETTPPPPRWDTPKEQLPTRFLPVGTRVGAILTITDDLVEAYGYGELIDDAVPPEDGLGHCAALRKAGLAVPVIRLDNGDLLYAPECKYAEASLVEALLVSVPDRRVDQVRIADVRAARLARDSDLPDERHPKDRG